jgi:hypothetical protein
MDLLLEVVKRIATRETSETCHTHPPDAFQEIGTKLLPLRLIQCQIVD